MVWTKQAASLAAASFSIVAHAGIIRDTSNYVDFADLAVDGAPLPSILAGFSNRRQKRQTSGGLLNSDPSDPTTENCNVAATYTLNLLGELEVDGSVISVNPGTDFIPLRPISPQGSITITFSLNNGALTWTNSAFFGGEAGFCQDPTGQVFATFADPAVSYPPNCTPVQLGAVGVQTCQDGTIVSSTTTATSTAAPISISIPSEGGTIVTTVGSTIVSTGPDGSVTTIVNSFVTTLPPNTVTTTPSITPPYSVPTTAAVLNGTLTLRPGLYTEAGFVNPAFATCSVVTESWFIGDTTLLPEPTAAVTTF